MAESVDIETSRVTDLDLRGLVSIRLIGASPDDVVRVGSQLGASEARLSTEPDVVIHYDEGQLEDDLTYVGLNYVGYSSEGFYLLDKNTGVVDARIQFQEIGASPCVIVCRPNLKTIPLLMDIVRVTLLAKGHVPVHGSAFVHGSVGVLVMGWAKGGKTETLLAYANHGATYVGDEWVVLAPHGERMFGLPVSIALRDWHMEQMRDLPTHVDLEHRLLFGFVKLLGSLHEVLNRTPFRGGTLNKTLRKALPRFRQHMIVRKSPTALFGQRRRQDAVPVDKVILIESRGAGVIEVSPGDPVTIARQMAASNMYEQRELIDYYHAFKFARPGEQNPILEELESRYQYLLESAFTDKEAYRVLHPYPVEFEALFEAMVDATSSQSGSAR